MSSLPRSEDPLFASAPPEFSQKQREEINQYIANHPEIRQLICEMMTAIAVNKPENPLEFLKQYFQSLQ